MTLPGKLNTITDNLTVATTELTDRATELENMIEDLTELLPNEGGDPVPPNDLNITKVAIENLKTSAANIRAAMQSGFREWNTLAESLRNAATAYNFVDEKAEIALNKVNELIEQADSATPGDGA